jgi:hypothetical protein
MQNLAQREDIVEDDTVGHQVVVLYDLPLFVAVISQDHSVATEWCPLRKPVERHWI